MCRASKKCARGRMCSLAESTCFRKRRSAITVSRPSSEAALTSACDPGCGCGWKAITFARNSTRKVKTIFKLPAASFIASRHTIRKLSADSITSRPCVLGPNLEEQFNSSETTRRQPIFFSAEWASLRRRPTCSRRLLANCENILATAAAGEAYGARQENYIPLHTNSPDPVQSCPQWPTLTLEKAA